ncbi:UDP-2,3-diacylglucosamine diphosphatase [Solimicrobium silvestre]|uniref:UDP-2,3-diacylglucosamine hydrolase n=1 Tax=Solimicrobium silvestre TaxID=2099400 RepID=A0A2S9GW08_9BURK|nr:UDP-2,3-diacylglucosamine diphosphatase [Solimicrobium silvestre]PRC91891.1 UDP-2,3-diacylglucosamine hydrolase [Solimicrobium silvestre]
MSDSSSKAASKAANQDADQLARPKAVALFISDLHLQAEMPATTAAFLTFLEQHGTKAEQLYLLGDIFEYWAGDDDLSSPFPQQIAQALRRVSDAGVALFWMAGNRDFLVGNAFSAATNATLLTDPHILEYNSQRYLITHGDQLCTDDIAYQTFRAQVRQPEWQTAFLARPLAERKALISAMRRQSQLHQKEQMQHSEMIMDVNLEAVSKLFASSNTHTMIHGHTHRPALHRDEGNSRYVLSDWDRDTDSGHLRGDWLALQADGSLQRYNALGNPVTSH